MVKQVNVALPEALARRIKSDAASLGVTLNDYTRVCYEQYLSKPIASRRVNFDGVKRKVLGRKLKP